MAILLCTVAVGWFAGEAVRGFYLSQTEQELENKARLIAPHVSRVLAGDHGRELQVRCQSWGDAAGVRLTIVDPSGRVLGDSQEDPAAMDNYANRPEILTALSGKPGRTTRYSRTRQTQMMYVARPVEIHGQTVAVIRTAVALSDVQAALRYIYGRIALGGLAMAAIAVAVTLIVFHRHINQPLRALQAGAHRFAHGDFSQRLPRPGSEEIGSLSLALSSMAQQLDEKIRTTTDQAQERHAILASMIEGVLAVDTNERIITFNEAAGRLLGADPSTPRGRPIQEVVRNSGLQQFIHRALTSQKSIEDEVVLHVDQRERYLALHGTVLQTEDGHRIGAVIVLHDQTRLRQLETVRQQFVANVSHELKTPISAVKAAAETLLDRRKGHHADSDRFLSMIARHADRLGAIVDDLLSLARIERESEQGQVTLNPHRVGPVLRRAVENCLVKAEAKGIQLILLDDAEDAQAMINAHLLEQAVTNLLDNAVNYCPEASEVRVKASKSGSGIVIEVCDNGPGIDPEHLPRIFERFYRPDHARSREQGGTGLGLAIVKHIATAHGGHVSVQSISGDQPGHGSRFSIYL